MTTAQTLAELFQRIQAKGDVPRDFPFKAGDFLKHIDDAVSQVVAEFFLEYKQYSGQENIHGFSLFRVKLPLQTDPELCLKYAQFTKETGKPINLVNDMGVQRVHGPKSAREDYTKQSPDFHSRFRDLPVLDIDRSVSYWIEGDKIIFDDRNLSSTQTEVIAHIIAVPSTLPETADLPIPSGKEQRVFELVLSRFNFTEGRPKDLTNDSRDQE